MTESFKVEPFRIAATDTELQDLQSRLRAARWPDKEVVDDWSQGIPLGYLRELVSYWAETYDWRARELRLNSFAQFRAVVGTGVHRLGVHFYHVRSRHPQAVPMIMTHGWPGSVVEFIKVFEPLTAPEKHGGRPDDAFHIVCPSLPGYGFSDKANAPGCGVGVIAGLWDELMRGLGYQAYLAQGGDWGASVTTEIGVQNRGACKAIHVNMPIALPMAAGPDGFTPAEQRALAAIKHYAANEAGYSAEQKTKPQTIGYALVDSPVALAAWIIEKFMGWTDCNGHPENALTRDELLDNLMLYWLPRNGASAARLYWESFGRNFSPPLPSILIPSGVSQFACELSLPPRKWVEHRYRQLNYWNEIPKGGHFAAFEQPELFVDELRAFRREIGALFAQ
jgi:pimeloyl-ACP methyl ester carboxylesterase